MIRYEYEDEARNVRANSDNTVRLVLLLRVDIVQILLNTCTEIVVGLCFRSSQ